MLAKHHEPESKQCLPDDPTRSTCTGQQTGSDNTNCDCEKQAWVFPVLVGASLVCCRVGSKPHVWVVTNPPKGEACPACLIRIYCCTVRQMTSLISQAAATSDSWS